MHELTESSFCIDGVTFELGIPAGFRGCGGDTEVLTAL